MSCPIESDVFFDGSDAADCERFFLAVKRRAFAEGKQNDDQWVAQYAATCTPGAALRWYERLDDHGQASWKLLRRALLDRYPDPDEQRVSTNLSRQVHSEHPPLRQCVAEHALQVVDTNPRGCATSKSTPRLVQRSTRTTTSSAGSKTYRSVSSSSNHCEGVPEAT